MQVIDFIRNIKPILTIIECIGKPVNLSQIKLSLRPPETDCFDQTSYFEFDQSIYC
jgi:hypothetical protein